MKFFRYVLSDWILKVIITRSVLRTFWNLVGVCPVVLGNLLFEHFNPLTLVHIIVVSDILINLACLALEYLFWPLLLPSNLLILLIRFSFISVIFLFLLFVFKPGIKVFSSHNICKTQNFWFELSISLFFEPFVLFWTFSFNYFVVKRSFFLPSDYLRASSKLLVSVHLIWLVLYNLSFYVL